jgi:hypothetical protein
VLKQRIDSLANPWSNPLDTGLLASPRPDLFISWMHLPGSLVLDQQTIYIAKSFQEQWDSLQQQQNVSICQL